MTGTNGQGAWDALDLTTLLLIIVLIGVMLVVLTDSPDDRWQREHERWTIEVSE